MYKTKDGKYVSVGALEPKFYEELLWVRLSVRGADGQIIEPLRDLPLLLEWQKHLEIGQSGDQASAASLR